MSANELVAELRRLNPGVRYGRTRSGASVGEWVESRGRFVPLYCEVMGGQWVQMYTPGGTIREVLTDGKPIGAGEWVE